MVSGLKGQEENAAPMGSKRRHVVQPRLHALPGLGRKRGWAGGEAQLPYNSALGVREELLSKREADGVTRRTGVRMSPTKITRMCIHTHQRLWSKRLKPRKSRNSS